MQVMSMVMMKILWRWIVVVLLLFEFLFGCSSEWESFVVVRSYFHLFVKDRDFVEFALGFGIEDKVKSQLFLNPQLTVPSSRSFRIFHSNTSRCAFVRRTCQIRIHFLGILFTSTKHWYYSAYHRLASAHPQHGETIHPAAIIVRCDAPWSCHPSSIVHCNGVYSIGWASINMALFQLFIFIKSSKRSTNYNDNKG